MDTGHLIRSGEKIHHVQEAAEGELGTWSDTVNVKVLMGEDVLALEAVKKSKVYPVIPNRVQSMVFGDLGNNSPVVNHAE